jgi:hypothetical protein
MARDKRQRLKTIPLGWALVSEASGDWLLLTTSVRNALDAYVTHWTKDGDGARLVYDRAKPETWAEVASHMWRNDVELVPILGGQIDFTLGYGDLTIDLTKRLPHEAPVGGKPALTFEQINDDREPMTLFNKYATTERP